jgi:sec-independent protein translocase protein TatA
MPEIGISGLIILLIVALLVFGPKRLPEIGRSLGRGMREFKDSVTGDHTEKPHAPEHELPAAPEDHEAVTEARERDTVV